MVSRKPETPPLLYDDAVRATGYSRQLGLFSATMLVVGGIIGAGIFLNPAIVAQSVGTGPATMATWGLGACIAIVGAFVFAELGARAPPGPAAATSTCVTPSVRFPRSYMDGRCS